MSETKDTPYVLRIRPNGPSAWTWEIWRRGTDDVVATAKMTYYSFRWTMALAERDATDALGSYLDNDQIELETFSASPRRLEQLQRETNKGEVREMNRKNEMQVAQQLKMSTVREMLEKSKGQIAAALPNTCTPERMMRITATAIQKTPKLLDCDPLSLIAAVMECAQLGLEPNTILGHAHLIPFHNGKTKRLEVQVILGYAGLIELALRSDKVSDVKATVVYEKDRFHYEEGLTPRIEHTPSEKVDKGQVKAAYAVAQLANGRATFALMWREEIDKIGDAVKEKIKEDWQLAKSPWVTNYVEMCKKTVIRRLSKTLPSSALQSGMAVEKLSATGASTTMGSLLDFEPTPALDVEPVDPTPEPPAECPPKKTPKKKTTAKKAPPAEPPADPAPPNAQPDPSEVQFDEYSGMIEAADSMTYIDKVQKLLEDDDVLNDAHLAELLTACDARRKTIHAARGERSNGGQGT